MQSHVFERYLIPNKGGHLLNIVHETMENVLRDGQQIVRGSRYGTKNVECGKFVKIQAAARYCTDIPLLSCILQLLLEDREEIQGRMGYATPSLCLP